VSRDLSTVRSFVEKDSLAVVSSLHSDGSIHSSVVNAGVLRHPVRNVEVVGFVTYGRVKLANLRRRPEATVTFRNGPAWIAVEGRADILGPEDESAEFDPQGLPQLLREVFSAAGGTHDDWDEYDRVMKKQKRAAVLIEPRRVYPR
jgi:PPOX class probable F420-dependent enzyme